MKSTLFARQTVPLLIALALLCPLTGTGAKKKPLQARDRLAEYVARVRTTTGSVPSTGSFYTPQSPYSDLTSDYKARNVNDLIVIQVVEQTQAAANGSVKSARTFAASSGISGLLGVPGPASGIQTIFSPSSSRTLNGQAQTSSDSSLTTSLAGRVVELLPNGALVIEAEREVDINNQHQTLIVRGVVRPGDVAPNNSVLSTAVSNLEVELKGRGVVSDGVAPPNRIMRGILKIVGF